MYGPEGASGVATAPPKPRMGILGHLWSSGLKLDPARAAAALPAAVMGLQGTMWGAWCLGAFASLIPQVMGKEHALPWATADALTAMLLVTSAFVGAAGPRALFTYLHATPIRPEDVEALVQRNGDERFQPFLELLRDAVAQDVPAEMEGSVRSALGALSEAVEQLPLIQLEPLDTAALRREASQLQSRAAQEADLVTAESLERRALAILNRAEANERASLLARRSHALREETFAQIAALREGLAALQWQQLDVTGMRALANAARQVAHDATHLASARDEVESCFQPAVGPAGKDAQTAQLRAG